MGIRKGLEAEKRDPCRTARSSRFLFFPFASAWVPFSLFSLQTSFRPSPVALAANSSQARMLHRSHWT